MGLFNKLKTALGDLPQADKIKNSKPKIKKPANLPSLKPKTKKKPRETVDPEKAKATKKGEPWVKVLNKELDPNDPGQGAFELDWNDKFVANLIRAGYQGKTDADIVDNWFQSVCRNVVLETWQQEQADPELRRTSNRRDLGDGRTEIS